MNAPRRPSHDTFDADLDLCVRDHVARAARVLVKYTFALDGRGAHRAAPTPLAHDPRRAGDGPRLVPGSDFWATKEATDVVVRGSAVAPEARPVRSMQVRARVGDVEKRVAVHGRRAIRWTRDGRAEVSAPEPFTEVALTWANAYGGIDLRVAPEGPLTLADLLAIGTGGAHPGAYPRNPLGKGYLVLPAAGADGLEMPNLEDPDDPLTPERLVVGDPRAWWRQPLPWCMDWVPATFFPRMKLFAAQADPWFAAPEEVELQEEKRGLFPRGLRAAMRREAEAQGVQTIHPRFSQEASPGLVCARLPVGALVEVEGMTEGPTRFALPDDVPAVTFHLEGTRAAVRPRLHSLEILPGHGLAHMVWGATIALPRGFVPGVHREIPVAVVVDGARPIAFEAPRPLRDTLIAPRA